MSVEKHGVRMSFSWEALAPSDRPNRIPVDTPKSPLWLIERRGFLEKWEKMKDAGLKAGFLEYEPCYECGGEIRGTTNTSDRTWVEDPLGQALKEAVAAEDALIESDLLAVPGVHEGARGEEVRLLGLEVVHQKQRDGNTRYRGIRQRGAWVIDRHPEWGVLQ